MNHLFDDSQTSIVRFCAKECELQQSGELSVAWMLDAWSFALEKRTGKPTMKDIIELGAYVEPYKNVDGFRRVGVRVGWDVKLPHAQIWGAMQDLVANQGNLAPEEFFREYEEIHPFRDGNGRTGAILFNWLRGSLRDPIWPPNYWDDPRRVGLKGC